MTQRSSTHPHPRPCHRLQSGSLLKRPGLPRAPCCSLSKNQTAFKSFKAKNTSEGVSSHVFGGKTCSAFLKVQRISSTQEASHLPSVPRPGSGMPLGGCVHSKWYPGGGWGPVQLSPTGKRSPEPTEARAPEQSRPMGVQPSSPEPRLGAEATAEGARPQKRPPQCQATGVRLSGRVTASSSPGISDCRQTDTYLPAAGPRRRAWLHGGWAGHCLVLDTPPACSDT